MYSHRKGPAIGPGRWVLTLPRGTAAPAFSAPEPACSRTSSEPASNTARLVSTRAGQLDRPCSSIIGHHFAAQGAPSERQRRWQCEISSALFSSFAGCAGAAEDGKVALALDLRRAASTKPPRGNVGMNDCSMATRSFRICARLGPSFKRQRASTSTARRLPEQVVPHPRQRAPSARPPCAAHTRRRSTRSAS